MDIVGIQVLVGGCLEIVSKVVLIVLLNMYFFVLIFVFKLAEVYEMKLCIVWIGVLCAIVIKSFSK